jgi:MYXO-CTERM domain-containing protein
MKKTKLTTITAIILSLGLLFGCNNRDNADVNDNALNNNNTIRDAADNNDNASDTNNGPLDVTDNNNNVTRNVAATNDQEDNDMDLGWIGLIGLAGLLGLRRRDDKR